MWKWYKPKFAAIIPDSSFNSKSLNRRYLRKRPSQPKNRGKKS